MSDPDNTNNHRPPRLPEHCPWPPEFPYLYPGRPEGHDPESPYNEQLARKAFGDEIVDYLQDKQLTYKHVFRGDWWQRAFLAHQGELDQDQLSKGKILSEKERFLYWNSWRFYRRYDYIKFSRNHRPKVPIDLEGANLIDAHLENADLFEAKLKNAQLSLANLENAVLKEAHLENAQLWCTVLKNAQLENVNLEYAELSLANLENANLDGAILNGADVRECRGLKFDSNEVDRIRIEGKAPDPWSILRRKYSGPLFMVHLLLLVAFLLPYVGHLMILTAESRAYSQLEQYLEAQDEMPEQVEPTSGIEQVKTAVEQPKKSFHAAIGRYKKKFEQTHTETKAIWPLLGWTRTDGWGRCYFFITIVILIYNGLRGYLTYNVSILRDAEERSRITPALEEYYNKKHSWYRLKKLAVQLWDKYKWQGLVTIAVSLLLACHIGFVFGSSLSICFGYGFLICLGVIIIILVIGLKNIRDPVVSLFRKLRDLLPGLYQWHLVARVLFWIAIVSLSFRVFFWIAETTVWVAN
jgi:pentapeptide repeat protein